MLWQAPGQTTSGRKTGLRQGGAQCGNRRGARACEPKWAGHGSDIRGRGLDGVRSDLVSIRRKGNAHSATMLASASSTFVGQRVTIGQRASAAPARAPLQVSAAGQSLVGEVSSNSMTKSCVVTVKRQVPHPTYQKRITLSKKYLVRNKTAFAVLLLRVA